MDCQNVFNAARDGKISELKYILEQKSRDEVRALVSALTNDFTPLIISCVNGHSDVVTYLLEQCQAGVDQIGSVDGLEGKPLYFAIEAGHFNIVKILVKHKASVTGTEEFESPLLLLACDNGHLEIVKYLIDHGAAIETTDETDFTPLQCACSNGHYEVAKYLVESGADVNKMTKYGDTALHASVLSRNLQLFEMLLVIGAKNTEVNGFTPLLFAARCGEELMVESIVERVKCTKQEIVNALELLGAEFVDRHNNIMRARDCWRRALHLRYEDEAFRSEKPVDKSPISSCVAITEVSSVEQLNELMEDEMRIQALLVRERILGPSSFDSIINIQRRGEKYAEDGNFGRCIKLWMYILEAEMNRAIDKALDGLKIGCVISSSLKPLTQVFYKMISEVWSVGMIDSADLFRDIVRVSENTLKPIESALCGYQNQEFDFINSHYFRDLLIIAMYLLSLMCRLQPHLKPDEKHSLKKNAYKLVHLNPKVINGFTPLHIASFKYSSALGHDSNTTQYEPEIKLPEFTFPSLDVVRLLLEVGACPNARDSSNNTPLHLAAMNRPCATDVFHALLKQGAHIDLFNNENQTPLQLLDDASLLDIYPLQHQNLQCLCAQEIIQHAITYKGSVHEKLCEFIELHSLR